MGYSNMLFIYPGYANTSRSGTRDWLICLLTKQLLNIKCRQIHNVVNLIAFYDLIKETVWTYLTFSSYMQNTTPYTRRKLQVQCITVYDFGNMWYFFQTSNIQNVYMMWLCGSNIRFNELCCNVSILFQ